MDELRNLRFLVPPFVFYLVLVTGLACDDYYQPRLAELVSTAHPKGQEEGEKPRSNGLPMRLDPTFLLATIVAMSVPIGFLIGAITVAALRVTFGYRGGSYEAGVRTETLERERKLLKIPWYSSEERDSRVATAHRKLRRFDKLRCRDLSLRQFDTEYDRLNTVVAFDHGIVRERFPGLYEWSARRWTSFVTAASSTVAVLLGISCVAALCAPIDETRWAFSIPGLVWLILAFVVTAVLWTHAARARRECMEFSDFISRSDLF